MLDTTTPTALIDHEPPPGPVTWSAVERLTALCDPGSLRTLRGSVVSRAEGVRAMGGDGVVVGTGKVGGRRVACYAQDVRLAGGSLGAMHADSIVQLQREAQRSGVPIVGFVQSAGARLQESTDALAGYARVFANSVAMRGTVPQISVVSGMCAGGGAYSPALTDFVVMTGEAAMFLTGPDVVRRACGETTTVAALGGERVHRSNGVAHFVVDDDVAAVDTVQRLLSYLPQRAGSSPPRPGSAAAPGADPAEVVPERAAATYDVRGVIERLADFGEMLEMAPAWARNVVTAFARIDGHPVGVVANQPKHLGGVLDVDACEKASAFIGRCSSYGIPLVVLVDTPGFLPGTNQESLGIIRRGAGLVEAFCAARVPRYTVVLRKAYGGAYIAMNCKDLGATLSFAWPQASIGIMDPNQAVRIIHRRTLAGLDEPEETVTALAASYAEEETRAPVAAARGHVDDVIEPADTRARLADALDLHRVGWR